MENVKEINLDDSDSNSHAEFNSPINTASTSTSSGGAGAGTEQSSTPQKVGGTQQRDSTGTGTGEQKSPRNSANSNIKNLPNTPKSSSQSGGSSICGDTGSNGGGGGGGGGDRTSLKNASQSSQSPQGSTSTVFDLSTYDGQKNTINFELETIKHQQQQIITTTSTRQSLLPWGTQTRSSIAATAGIFDMPGPTDGALRPGEIVMRTLFTDFTLQAEKKIESVMLESADKNLAKLLQRGEDLQFDQLLSAFGSVAEHCLPSLLLTILAWHKRQLSDTEIKSDLKRMEKMANKSNVDIDLQLQRRESAVEFLFCLALIEILKQLPFHPGHEDIIKNFENLAFKHFKYRDGLQNNPNANNIHMIADLYAEVIGVLAQSRFASVRKRFMSELKELRLKEPSPHTTQSIISLLMGMKFFRVKMVPIEEFEASFQFMHECAQYFLEIKDKDIKHALAGLFVEILVPVAAAVKNEVNVPCVKNFVDLLYSQTLDACTKSKHKLALFPLVTCLLCVSQKTFFLTNWHYFLAMCLSNLKNRDSKMSRVALESLYRLLWVYMIRIKCESNSATHSRLQSIVNSLFPRGSKAVVPRDTPLNIFVKIIQFIAQERLDFAMREIVFELLYVGRPIKIILTPERMSIGLRAFLVVADSLQQKDGEPPMPRTVGVLPSGNTLRVKKTYLNKMLTDDTARSIGMSSYFPHVRRVFVDILRALDTHHGRPLMMTNTQNQNKEPDEMLTGERKPRIDLFRTCVAAVPRLIPDTMTGHELVDMLSRLTVHMDEELRQLAHQSLQTLVNDFPDLRQDIIHGYTQFLTRDVVDTFPQLVEHCMRLLLAFITAWNNALMINNGNNLINTTNNNTTTTTATTTKTIQIKDSGYGPSTAQHTMQTQTSTINSNSSGTSSLTSSGVSSITQITTTTASHGGVDSTKKNEQPLSTTMHYVQGFALVMLCNCRPYPRKVAGYILKECKKLMKALNLPETEPPLIDVIDKFCPQVLDKCLPILPQTDKMAILNANIIDLQWITDRTGGIWTFGHVDDNTTKSSTQTLNNVQQPSLTQQCDPWSICVLGLMERQRIVQQCPSVCQQAWPVCYQRVTTLFSVIDPTPVNDNRASLLRGSAPPKKTPSESQRDAFLRLWKNLVAMGMRLVPQIPSVAVRCASPDLSLSLHDQSDSRSLSDSLDNIPSNVFGPEGLVTRFTLPLSYGRKEARQKRLGSSPDSLNADRSDKSTAGSASPLALYKLIVPLLRCEVADVRDAAVIALGMINHDALKDLMDELVLYIREAVDRKQENMRRRRRRDALRLQLVKVLEKIAENGTFGVSQCVIERETLHPTFVEYIEGARLYLETETDKDNTSIREVKTRFCDFIRKMIKNFSLESWSTLLSRDLKRNLFNLFASWSGPFAKPLGIIYLIGNSNCIDEEKLQFSALQAMSALLCCGHCFDHSYLSPNYVSEEGLIYPWLDMLLTSKDEKIYQLAKDTVVLLLETNPDVGQLLEWVIDRCYTAVSREADACFLSLAAIFSAREYPCDHYTSVINVTLLMTGCPRVEVHSTALQLLQVLDKRFFGTVGPLHGETDKDNEKTGTLDTLLSGDAYCRSQMYLSKQMAQLRPELTMPMFSEITHRFQTARAEVRALLLQCLMPWLENMELVAANVPPATPLSYIMYYPDSGERCRREGSGSTEATEMILNNLFYITTKFADVHPRDIEELWGTLCQYWPNNLKVILRYLVIISGMAPNELLSYAKRVALYLARTCPNRLLDELMTELQTVETLNCLIERTETPPFYRLTSMRKASSHSDGPTNAGGNDSRIQDLTVEKGTIHTKRHSGEDPIKSGTCKSDSGLRSFSTNYRPPRGSDKIRAASGPSVLPRHEDLINEPDVPQEESFELRSDPPLAPHPLPMPEYGGYFAPLTEFLPDISIPISGFHRCNVAVMLLTDIVVDGIPGLDWTLHVPLMLHILFLGLDHTRPIVRDHCKQLLLNLLIVLAEHNDHLTVSRILLNSETNKLQLGLTTPQLAVIQHNFTEPDSEFDSYLLYTSAQPIFPTTSTTSNNNNNINNNSNTTNIDNNNSNNNSSNNNSHNENNDDSNNDNNTSNDNDKENENANSTNSNNNNSSTVSTEIELNNKQVPIPAIIEDNNATPQPGPTMSTAHVIKSLIRFLSYEYSPQPLWNYEDITAKVWSIKSAEQLTCFLRHILKVYTNCYAHASISERWAQTALQLGLSCSSRHYAGRSLQIFRALNVPINSRMLSDILSRLVETVAEQGEDMQGYVTELLLTLEAAVESLDSDFRPLDVKKDIFKSTPNLNNKDGSINMTGSTGIGGKKSPGGIGGMGGIGGIGHMQQSNHMMSATGHTRSTSYSVAYCTRKQTNAIIDKQVELRNRAAAMEMERNAAKYGIGTLAGSCGSVSVGGIGSAGGIASSLSRSRSAQSLKLLGDTATQDDKMTILAQLFWLAVSLLESDYEHEFLLACRLLSRVLHRLPLDRPDARDKIEKLQQQLKWTGYPGVHALLLKGCTHAATYEPTISLLSQLAPLLSLPVCDPTQSGAFPMNVIALLPYMLLHYEDANEVCIRSAENIAQVSSELGSKLENLGTVMTLYSRKTFSKESFQWTKCVVKYLYDTYAHMGFRMLAFLIEVLEKGLPQVQVSVLNVIHCMLHYIDLSSPQAHPISGDLLRVIAKYLDNSYWKEALKILKLVVTRSSSLQVVPHGSPNAGTGSSTTHYYHGSFSDSEVLCKKELAGRTMEFTFDVSQTPLIGRRILLKSESSSIQNLNKQQQHHQLHQQQQQQQMIQQQQQQYLMHSGTPNSPRRSASLSPADSVPFSGWKRPWMSQGRVRECLVNLLTTCGQRVGLPKSPSVIFSQSSDLMERQSSAASSTEETSGAQQDLSGGSRRDDGQPDFGVFKDFDFLEYESESIEGESTDNFNWGVRRRPLSEGDSEPLTSGGGGGGSGSGNVGGNIVGGTGAIGGPSGISGMALSSSILGAGPGGLGSGSIGSVGCVSGIIGFDNISASGFSARSGYLSGMSGGSSHGHSTFDESLSEKTPILSGRRGGRQRLHPDDSSDDEVESESPLDEYQKPMFSKLPYLVGPPTSLSIRERRHRRDSVSRSDTSGSSAGDLGDITPCNASPHLPGLISYRAPIRDEAEEAWRRSLQNLLSSQPITHPPDLLHQLYKLIKELTNKTIGISRDSMKYFTGVGTQLGHRISVLSDLLATKEEPPKIWYNANNSIPISPRLFESLRFSILEVQEHLETYFDRKDHVFECLDTVKTSCKLALFSDTESAHEGANHLQFDPSASDVLVDLGRSIYKLIFQLLLLIESDHKMAINIITNLQQNENVEDLSKSYISVRGALLRCVDDADMDSLDTSTSTECDGLTPIASPSLPMTTQEFENHLIDLIDHQKWTFAIALVKQQRKLSMHAITSSTTSSTATVTTTVNTSTLAQYSPSHFNLLLGSSTLLGVIAGGDGIGNEQQTSGGCSSSVIGDGNYNHQQFDNHLNNNIDDLSYILNIYSQRLIKNRNDAFISSRSENELTEIYKILMENLYHVSAALTNLERSLKNGGNGGGGGGSNDVVVGSSTIDNNQIEPDDVSGGGGGAGGGIDTMENIDVDNLSQENAESLNDQSGVDIITTL